MLLREYFMQMGAEVRLVERMPVLTLPAWQRYRTQPIDERDMIAVHGVGGGEKRGVDRHQTAQRPQHLCLHVPDVQTAMAHAHDVALRVRRAPAGSADRRRTAALLPV